MYISLRLIGYGQGSDCDQRSCFP